MLYYTFGTFCFSVALVYFTSAINVFFRDMAQIVGIVLQYGMWVVPVMIAESQYPEFLRPILKFNPMYYIVEGYRDALIRQVGFLGRSNDDIVFLGCSYFIIFNR